MRETLSFWLAQAVMLGSICLALRWLWQGWLRVIGVSYEMTDDERTRASDDAAKDESGIPHGMEG